MLVSRKAFYIICLLSLFLNLFQISFSKSHLFEKAPYQPTFEFSLKGGNQRTLGRAGTVIPLQSSDRGLWFTQLWGLWDSEAAKEWNVGLGYRHELMDWIIGAYGFFDKRLSALNHYHSQLTVGAEALGENLEARINGYIPTTSAKAIGTSVVGKANRVSLVLTHMLEKPLGGVDIEIGGPLTSYKTLQGFLTYYHFNGRGVKAINGIRLRGQLQLTNDIALTGEASYDRLRKECWFAGMQLSFRLGTTQQKKALSQKMTQMVIRDVDVITDCYKEKIYQNLNSIYLLQKGHNTLVSKVTNFVEIKEFSTSSSIRDKIQSIVIFSPKDIRLKPRMFDHLKSMDDQLISVPCYDIQGMSSLKDLSIFVEHSYWRIALIGRSYAIKVHVKGLGGGDKEETISGPLSLLQLNTSSSASTHSQMQSEQTQSQANTHEETTAFSGASDFEVIQKVPYNIMKCSKLLKPIELGHRPNRNFQFVARENSTKEDALMLLKRRFDKTSSPIISIITGPGGIGKTQLAVEYVEQSKEHYDGIFWVQVNSLSWYQPYIEELDIALKEIDPDLLAPIIHKSLAYKGYKKILWIYDDVPNTQVFYNVLFNKAIKDIWQPLESQVHVLVTSRSQADWPQWLSIELTPFTIGEAQAYIDSFFIDEQSPFSKPSREEVEALNICLNGLPLTIAQAIHYLKHQDNKMDIAQYINAYDASLNQASWLDNPMNGLSEQEQAIWITWDITRKQLTKEADLLLQMCCFLSNDYISKRLFSPLWEDNKVHDYMTELYNYSLITPHRTFESFNIHILLQKILLLTQDKNSIMETVLQKMLLLKDKKSIAFNQLYYLLEQAQASFDEKDANTWREAKSWLPHISTVLAHVENKATKIKLFGKYGIIAYTLGENALARSYFNQALTLQNRPYGRGHIYLANTLNNLGNIELRLNLYETAKTYYSEALILYKRYHKETQVQRANTLSNLGHVEFYLEDYEPAKAYFNQALTLYERCYGKEHIQVANLLNNLGAIEKELGYYETAKAYYNHALELYQHYYKENHTEMTKILTALGLAELELGRYEAAQSHYNQALALQTYYYGERHIQLAHTLVNLGIVELHLGHYEEAKDYYNQALLIQIGHYGEAHIQQANTLNNLGNAELKLARYEAATTYYTQALTLYKHHYQEDRMQIANALLNLGNVSLKLGHYAVANDYYNQALMLKDRYYKKEHIHLAYILNNLGLVQYELGHYETAKDYYNRALALKTNHYGQMHIELANTLNNLGAIDYELGYYEAATDYYTQALALQTHHYGQTHIQLVDTFVKLGKVYQKLGNNKEAKNYAKKYLKLQHDCYGAMSIEFLDIYNLLGSIYLNEKNIEKAFSYYQKSLAISEMHYKTEHIKLAEPLIGLGHINLAQMDLNQALSFYHRALAIQETHYNGPHIRMLNTLKSLIKIYQQLNQLDKAGLYLERIKAIQQTRS